MNTHWTYADLAREFGLSPDRIKRRMPEWQAMGVPSPLPWSLREKRWNPEAVLKWKARQEVRTLAAPPQIRMIPAA